MTPVESILGSPGLLGSESETIAVDVENLRPLYQLRSFRSSGESFVI